MLILVSKTVNKKEMERSCPTCGQPMNFVKFRKDINKNKKSFNRWQIWNCLNCNEEWEVDVLTNMFSITLNQK